MPVMRVTVQQVRTVRLLDERVLPALLLPMRPTIRAFLLGYASTTLPRLLTLFLTYLSDRRKGSVEGKAFWPSLRVVLSRGFEYQRFPTFCAVLVSGTALLQVPFRMLIGHVFNCFSLVARERITRWFASFIAGWLSIKLLQSKQSAAFTNTIPSRLDRPDDAAAKSKKFAGRTMDLTLFAATRALDAIVGEIWDGRRRRRTGAQKWIKASSLADSTIFASSCALIMWCWIYQPERLPQAYNQWISKAAAVDSRLIIALNQCRWGELIYGRNTGQAPLLQSMCADYHWPEIWGDPAITVPIPCEMVHMGTGKSCEYHAFSRFLKGFLMASGMYGPLSLALKLRNPSKEGMKQALVSSIRSSAFLGSFIALFYYGVCLARTRIGPNIVGKDIQSRQAIDSGICIGSGCVLCGWSLLLENPGRQKDMALFVAPRALATLLPRRYEMKHQWKETALFATSTAIVFTCVQENPARVRGVFGKILSSVLK